MYPSPDSKSLAAPSMTVAGPPESPALAPERVIGSFGVLTKTLGDKLLNVVLARPSDENSLKILHASTAEKPYLPGQPRIRLPVVSAPAPDDGDRMRTDLHKYLKKCHLSKELDSILPFMKYIFVQTPSNRHIMPLHHQEAHGRKVLVDEHPGLHLVWYYERIFIKPIPAYFYSAAFWEYAARHLPDVYASAVGFMRSYYWLIQYEIDYEAACKAKLIPKLPGSDEYPSYADFCDFVAPFRDVGDAQVCRRYHYGELRLTRLNKTTMLFRFKLAYFHIHPQWGSYLSHLLAPIITIFVVISAVLNSFQVTLAAVSVMSDAEKGDRWDAVVGVSAYFPVAVVIIVAVIIATGLFGLVIMGLKDLVWAKTVRSRKKKGELDAGEKSHGLVW